jgi:hypothetical protein
MSPCRKSYRRTRLPKRRRRDHEQQEPPPGRRACIAIGKLSKQLEKAEHKGPGAVLPAGGKYKADALVAAGISTSAKPQVATP